MFRMYIDEYGNEKLEAENINNEEYKALIEYLEENKIYEIGTTEKSSAVGGKV